MKLFSLLDTKYNDYISRLQNYLSKSFSGLGSAFGSNTIFGQIVTVVGNAIQNVMLYIEDALVEQNKYTAQRKKSIYGLAALSGYMPSYGKASIVTVKLDFMPFNSQSSDNSYNVVLYNGTRLTCTQNGLLYNIMLPQESIILNPTDNATKYFSAVQGNFESQRFISTGGKYYSASVSFVGNLDLDYFTVRVNNNIWARKESLYDMLPNENAYVLKPAPNGSISIVFGNSIHGAELMTDDIIDVTYLIHDGEYGNVDSTLETYFVFNSNLYDINGDEYNGNEMFNVTFANNDSVSSGSNADGLLDIKNMIGLNSRSLVLTTPDNYKEILSRFGFCGYNRTWSDPNSAVINSLIIKNFRSNITNISDYFTLKEDDFKLNDIQKRSIFNYIASSGNQLANVKYGIFDPDLCKYAMWVYVKMKSDKYNKEIVKTNIRNAIGSFFINIKSDYFIPKSDIAYIIKLMVDGIDSIDIYILSEQNEKALIEGKYVNTTFELNNVTGQYIKKTENVKLYDGENPNLGLDAHGNILLNVDSQFPVLMGGWKYKNDNNDTVLVDDPLTVIIED